jgi:uncharacterized protein
MHLVGGQLVFTATDLADYLECEHLPQLETAAALGKLPRPEDVDPTRELACQQGLAHERRFLDHLRAQGTCVVEIPWTGANREGLDAGCAATLAAMRAGVAVIAQAALFDGRWLGYADFLLRVESPSALGAYSYEIADAKLARTAKASAVLQMCAYADLLTAVQGREPERIHLVLGDGMLHPYRLRDYAAYYRAVRARFETAVAAPPTTYPDPVEHCAICSWSSLCGERRHRDDHLSLVADIRRDQIRHLTAAGIRTVAELAALDHERIDGMPRPTLDRLQAQAVIQVRQRNDGNVTHELLPPRGDGIGFGALPEPSDGDVFLDLEGDPFADGGRREYLFGIVEIVGGAPVYHAIWAHDHMEERRAFERVVDFIVARRITYPGMHVVHYAAYEPAALKRLMGEHATREAEIDGLLRAGALVDLYAVVRQSMRVSQESYALKKLEPLYMPPRETTIRDGASSIVAYEQWRISKDPAQLDAIARYNRDDCISLWRLRDWLETQRQAAEERFGMPIPRPGLQETPPTPTATELELEALDLVASLAGDVPDDPQLRSADQNGRWLAAQLVSWHRREDKPDWWAYFERMDKTDEELIDDAEALGGLRYDGVVEREGKKVGHRYRFDPSQEHRIAEGDSPHDPQRRKRAGKVTRVDNPAGVLELQLAAGADPSQIRALIPPGPISADAPRDGVRRVARWIAAHGMDAPGPYRAVRDLLLRRPPRIAGMPPGAPLLSAGETVVDAARRLVLRLEDSYLPIQGPPGTGKTYLGAQMIVDLIGQGRRVGIAAHTHRAIANLLEAACLRAAAEGPPLVALQRAEPAERCDAPGVELAADNGTVVRRLAEGRVQLVAGTPWLFARQELENAVDVLFVDEAAQISLANVVAMGGATRSLVLLGDPCQLAQPSKGSHPPGAEASALGHVLAGATIIPPGRGLLLTTTWRLHPDLCHFTSEVMYEGLLEAHESCAAQTLDAGPLLVGAGPRYWPTAHTGNRISCAEEAQAVAEAATELIGRPWTDRTGQTRALTIDDILVVTPYNAQVARLRACLPAGARVGTVDKFQGQEAPIAFVSMATSTAEDQPRGTDFLFSLNRLNVAVSRARSLAVLVCNPDLLRIRCRTPEQMRLINAFCRFIELAPGPAGERQA